MEACELLSVELRLDRLDAELAAELPPHLRSYARAYAGGAAPPRAPDVLLRATTLATARAALAHPLLADRGLALLRLAAPLAIESDAGVAAARAADPSWDALAALAATRDGVALARFGRRAIDVVHLLHGCAAVEVVAPSGSAPALPPPVAGWSEPDAIVLDDAAIAQAWGALSARHGVTAALGFARTDHARPRAFAIEPGREVIVVIGARITTPAARFAVLHELGHALAALAGPAGIPRALDEAAAAYVGRAIERADHPWYSPAAGPARARRVALARLLDRIERCLPAIVDRPAERPPWALWHDPAAQAAYVFAEALAERIERDLGVSPGPGDFAAVLAALRDQSDRRDVGL